MKTRLLLIGGVSLAAILLSIVLFNNKNIMAGKVIADKVIAYPVTVGTVIKKEIKSETQYIGVTHAMNDIELLSETQGRVTEVLVNTGSAVRKGTVIAQVDDEMLKAQYVLAQSSLEKAKKDLQRFENLYTEGNISINEVETARITVRNAEAQYTIAKKTLSNTKITSPVTGMLTSRYINVGSTVSPGTPIANIVDISKIKIVISVPEKDIRLLKMYMPAIISCDELPDKKFTAKVISIGVKADESHNYPVELIVENNAGSFNAGMFVNTHFMFATMNTSLLIPRLSLVGSIKDPRVYVVESGVAHERKITVTGAVAENIIVNSGVREGEIIVLSGQNNLEEGAKITIRENR
ncbi:MAG: efflux RND transporter periplasmic adaptor subunit [Ignavibacteria bacterium]|nr:efflux RND transporter periplasmic adaptor subunit [Ignavibacteria bacterium]